LNERPN